MGRVKTVRSKSSIPMRQFNTYTEEVVANSETLSELISKSKSLLDDNGSEKSQHQANTTTGMSLYEEMLNCGSINETNQTNQIFETSFSDDGIQVKDNVMSNVSGNTTNEMYLEESNTSNVESKPTNGQIFIDKILKFQEMQREKE